MRPSAPVATAHGPSGAAAPAPPSFNARLADAIERTGSLLCVGLDPRPERLETPLADVCRRIVDATIEAAAAFKPNSAFFEQRGAEGWQALETVVRHIGGDRVVLLDAKRGDIGPTAEAYARAAFGVIGADAVTVSPYLGGDAVAPFLADPGRGAFVLCHTSNPGAQDVQTLPVDGRPLYLHVADLVAGRWNAHDNAGLVVGATYPAALEAVRDLAPRLPILVPGVGAQGGDLEAALAAGLDRAGGGLVVNSSREILHADDPGTAARRLRDALNAARARHR